MKSITKFRSGGGVEGLVKWSIFSVLAVTVLVGGFFIVNSAFAITLPTQCPGVIVDYNVIVADDLGNVNDTINGTSGPDFIDAGDGNNTVNGMGGNDCIVAGSGDDTITTLEGNDVILVGDGNNTVSGGDGNDNITAGDGNDTISGEAGVDTCEAGLGENTVSSCENVPVPENLVFIDTSQDHIRDVGEISYPTIQAAVDAAVSGDWVQATHGTYEEHVTVDKSLTINGANVDVFGDSEERTEESTVDGEGTGAPFAITADNVTIDGFTIQGGQNGLGAGIHTTDDNSGYIIKNNIIRDNVMGIYLNSDSEITSMVSHNLFDDNNREGSASGNGIYSDQGLRSTNIMDNTFTGGHTNTSIILVGPTHSFITISGNALDNEISFTNVSAATISNNTITNSPFHGIELVSHNTNIDITGNYITGVKDGYSAIRIHNIGDDNGTITITNNSIKGNHTSPDSIWFGYDTYGINSDDPDAEVTANFNDLSDNDIAVYYGTEGEANRLDVENNWWGCAGGPDGEDENCGIVSDNTEMIDFSPWLSTFNLSGNDPVTGQIMNSDGETGEAVGFDGELEDKFTSSGANEEGEAIVAIDDDNTAEYDIDGSGPVFGDTTVNGMALFAGQDSTLLSSLVLNPDASSISGMKWNDLNDDGSLNPGEPGLAEWTINLFSYLVDGEEEIVIGETPVATTTTEADGEYSFNILDPNLNYLVCEVPQSGWEQTSPASAADGTHLCANGTVGYSAQNDEGEHDDFINNNFGNHQIPTPPSGGGGGGGPAQVAPTSTPEVAGATTFDLAQFGLKEGNLIRAAVANDPDVYIVNEFGSRRLFLNPAIFGFYGHLGGYAAVKNVTTEVRDAFTYSALYRNCETNDPKVYGLEITAEDQGLLHWVNMTGDQAVAQDAEFFKKVFCINSNEFNWYTKSSTDYTLLSQVPVYSRK